MTLRNRRQFLKASAVVAAPIFIGSAIGRSAGGDSSATLPRLKIDDFKYAGAFRLPAKKFGASNTNFSQGPLAFCPDRRSIYVVGHSHQQAIAEFKIPELVKSTVVSELAMADEPIQPFAKVLDRTADGNPDGNNAIGGLLYVPGPNRAELLVNTYQYYDAPADNRLSMLAMRDAADLAKCKVDGYFELEGRPGHTAGWMSPIPEPWQAALGGRYLTGTSGGIPIISRSSVGPSAFVFDPRSIAGVESPAQPVKTKRLLDFSLAHPLHKDLMNESRENTIWNHLSRAVFGLIIPGTRTYATFGHSGGNESGVGYKIVQDNGHQSGGYSTYKVKDNYHYYWLWDVDDMARVGRGEIESCDVRPYEYGIFRTPFASTSHRMGGGTFDPASGLVYLTAQGADREQGEYANPPIVMAFKVGG